VKIPSKRLLLTRTAISIEKGGLYVALIVMFVSVLFGSFFFTDNIAGKTNTDLFHEVSKAKPNHLDVRLGRYEKGAHFDLSVKGTRSSHNSSVLFSNLRSDDARCSFSNANERKNLVACIATVDGFAVDIPEQIASDVFNISIEGTVGSVSVPKAFWYKQFSKESYDKKFNRNGGFLAGALLVLTIFALFVSYLLRDTSYLIFAVWTVSTLRIVLVSGGWNFHWLDLNLPVYLADFWYRFTLTLHPILTCALFHKLIKPDPSTVADKIINGSVVVCGCMLIVALFLPLVFVAPVVWLVTFVGTPPLVYVAVKQVSIDKSKTSLLYLFGWLSVFGALLQETLIASKILPFQFESILSAQTSAIIAVLFTAGALVEKINVEKAERIKAQSNEIAAKIHEMSSAGLASFDKNHKLLVYNETFRKYLSQLDFSNFNEVSLKNFLSSKEITTLGKGSFEIVIKSDALADRWLKVDSIDRKSSIDLIFLDITDQKIAEEKLQEAANRDPLTNLYNRFKMIDLLEQRLVTNIESTVTTDCIAMIDIDAFDRVITNFGHGVGDDVLLAYRDRIQELLPTTATLGRLSADTLIVLMPNTPLNEARYVVQAILNSIHKAPFETRVLTVAIKASAGVSVIESKTSKEVLAACDSALQDAKAKGGGQLIAYGERDKAWLAHKVEQELMAEFSQAIPFDRFQIVMQPIVTLLNAKEDIRYEALIRMKGKDGNMLTPDSFLPALEKIGLMSQLDRWVVRQVLEFLERESNHFARLTYASVNLSGASINDERFTDELLRLAAKHPHLVRKVCFEITENIALADMEATKRFIHRLRIIGARIALDDFGAGYSSFSYLAQLKVDSIKIDGSLVRGIDEDPAKQAIVKTIVDLGKALGSEVVAEWVETPKTLAILGRLGVDAGQGWALGKPVSMADIAAADHGASFITDKNIAAILGINQSELTNA
jgi:diguanylate cyclase (GGDEF)-like protein